MKKLAFRNKDPFCICLLIIVVTSLYNLGYGSNLFPSVFFPSELIVSGVSTMIYPECAPRANNQNISSDHQPINRLSSTETSSSKNFKEHRKVGNGKKTGWKILLAVAATIFFAVTLISILVIPLYESLGEPVEKELPIIIGVAAISLALCFGAISLHNKIENATAHLKKPK